jgi:hypothetical protein
MKQGITRRKVLQATALAGAFPFITFGSSRALADSSQLDPENTQAMALEYTHQSAMADKVCGNCSLYSGDVGNEWGPCAIFPGQNVAMAGWCKAWAAKG